MGIISSIFGERPSAPQTGGFTVGAEIPKELAPFYKDILGKSQALYNDSVSQGYQPYTGPSLAEFTPEQQQAFTGIAGLQGQQAPVYQEAMGMTREAATPITTEEITEYMNPYQQAVVDIEKREAQKQYQSQVVPQLAAKAAMAQPFGGSRQAILEGMAADTQQRLLGDIQAKGSAQAYQDSVNLLTQQRAQQGNAAGQLATMAPNQFKTQLAEFGALQGVGEEKQKLSQQALNEAYGQYLKEQEYPFQQLGRYQSVVTGAPISQREYVPPTPAGPSATNQLLGGLGSLASTYGAFGGFSPGGFMGMSNASSGGGIGQLPVIKRQVNGSIMNMNAIDPPADPNSLVRRQNESVEQFGRRVRVARGEIPALARDVGDAERIANNESFMSKIKNVFARQKLKSEARGEPTYVGPDGTVIVKGKERPEMVYGMETGLIEPDSKIDDLKITGNPSTEAARKRILTQQLIESGRLPPKVGRELPIKNTTIKPIPEVKTEISPEVDPAVVIENKKKEDLEKLSQAQLNNKPTQNKAKDKTDKPKADKPDIYADARDAEDKYLEALGNRETRIQGDIDKLGVQEREAQFGNLAMMFTRLANKPGSVFSALVESTGEILPAALKTKNEFAKEGRRLKVAIEDAQLGELKTTADIKKSRAGLKSKSAQQALTNALEERKVVVKEREAKVKEWKAKNPDVEIPGTVSKAMKENASLKVDSFLNSMDDNQTVKLNSIIKEYSGAKSPADIKNFLEVVVKDERIQWQIASEINNVKAQAKEKNKPFTNEIERKIIANTITNMIVKNKEFSDKADGLAAFRFMPALSTFNFFD